MKRDKINNLTSRITSNVSESFEKEYQKNIGKHSDELPGLAAANALHDSIPAFISLITEEILKSL